jgi:penicillin-binding protein 2
MPRRFLRRRRRHAEINPDEILIDTSNISDFDRDRFEGRIERPLSPRSFVITSSLIALLSFALLARAGILQVVEGAQYAKQARENQLAEKVIFADRGVLQDRTGEPLAWNERTNLTDDFAQRLYAAYRGLAHVIGYAKGPAKDSSGFYFRDEYQGIDGAEKAFDARLEGENGLRLTETDARGDVVSEAAVRSAVAGETITLSLDAGVNQALFDALATRVSGSRFQGGAGAIMDVRTGELLALTSYPEYSQTAMTQGDGDMIANYNSDRALPFLNRATDGLYAPGSIIKPIVAAAAINEGVIDEYKQILSTGSISIPNPYNPELPTVFKDWRVNGWTDAREAIAVSSDVYFYAVGGGYQDQLGLGIARLDKYLGLFGFGEDAGLAGFSEVSGNIPTPEWKAKTFPDDPTWRLGNTYHTSIGQYGTQVTPLQAARATAAIANNGTLLIPKLLATSTPEGKKISMSADAFAVAREGMRQSVTTGIAQAVKFPFVSVAAKTGTAEVGARKEYVNSWMIGFWPYENPRYAYAIVLEKGPAGTLVGAPATMAEFFRYMEVYGTEYLN